MRKYCSKLTVLLALFVLTAACTFSGCRQTDMASGKSGADDPVRIAIGSDTGTMDPAGEIALTFLSYAPAALDELLTFDGDGQIVYRGAISYESNEDATVWTFHLRKEARWSDGTPVTAADYIHTIRRALDVKSASKYAVYLFPIRNAKAIYEKQEEMDSLGVFSPDPYTLRFELEKPCVYFLDLLRLPVYMPSCEKTADGADTGWDRDPKRSLSNGPYTLEEYTPKQYFTLKKNPYYWDRDTKRSERLIFRFFDDQQSAANAFEAGEVDVACNLSGSIIRAYEGKEELLVTDLIATRYLYPNLHVKPLDDVRVRRALALAIDRKSLCALAGEDTHPTYALIAKYMKDRQTGQYYSEEMPAPFSEDVQQARQLLAQAGYPEGKGFPKLSYSYPTIELDTAVAQVLKEQWKENLGIDIELNPQELQTHYAARRAGEFDISRMNWTADFADPYTYLSMLLSDSTYNCSGIKDETYDGLVEASDSETDPQKRLDLMTRAQQLAIGEEFYAIPLFAMKGVNLVDGTIKGVGQIPASGALDFRNIYREAKQ